MSAAPLKGCPSPRPRPPPPPLPFSDPFCLHARLEQLMKCHAARPRARGRHAPMRLDRRETGHRLAPRPSLGLRWGRLLKRHKIHSAEAALSSPAALARSLSISIQQSGGKWQSGAHSISAFEVVGKKGGEWQRRRRSLGIRKPRVKREYRRAWHIGVLGPEE